MRILVTGSNGFVGKNLVTRLNELKNYEVLCFDRNCDEDDLAMMASKADWVFHLAGVNRPEDDNEFLKDNLDLTKLLVESLVSTGNKVPIILTSSIQAKHDNPYGVSKAAAEQAVLDYMQSNKVVSYIYRLPNVFGKWCKPNYNSVVATFCHNIVHDLPIDINDENASLELVHIDDVCDDFISLVSNETMPKGGFREVQNIHHTTVGEIVKLLNKFKDSRANLSTEDVGVGFTRAMYSTYLSYLEPDDFKYEITNHNDARGSFAEMLKTNDSGQISFFSAKPGVIRGGHYHHTKTEKFLVIKGNAKFRFENILTKEYKEILVSGDLPEIVDTSPGWSHDIQNIGKDEMFVMLWANECFDQDNPDTIAYEINNE